MAGRPRTRTDEEVFAGVFRAIGARGPRAVTMADLAREAGLSASTLSERFGSRRALLLAAARSAPSDAASRFAAARARAPSPLSALQDALVDLSREVRTRARLAHHLAFLELDVADPDFRRVAARHAERLREEIAGLVGEAIAAGEVQRSADPERLARVVHLVYDGALVEWGIGGRGALADAVARDVRMALEPWVSEAE